MQMYALPDWLPTMTESPLVLALTSDRLVLDGLERLGRDLNVDVCRDEQPGRAAPVAVVLDLEQPGALDELERWRQRHPAALLAGHVATLQRELWLEAQRAGCDLVSNRGALAAQLRRTLGSWRGPDHARVALFELEEAAGRLGLVFRTEDTAVGPVAVYRVERQLVAVADVCPHAGARLSDGELDGSVVTCPRHGSQFDVGSGERLRGPADLPLETFTLHEEGGYVYLTLPQ